MRNIILIYLIPLVYSCTLCHFRTPPRPRPLDQYKLPRMGNLDFEKMPQFCNTSKNLPVEQECREQFEKIFCSTDKLTDSLTGCQSLSKSSLSAEQQCSKCAHQRRDNMWVIKWFDSFGKPAAGITEGNYYWLGDYELCEDMRRTQQFDGQYCRIEIEVPDAGVESGCPQTDPLSIVVGACFPSACSIPQLTKISSQYLEYNFKVECESESSWSSVTYILLLVVVVFLIPQLIASTQKDDIDSVLGCFSINENAKRVMSTRRENPHLHVVHGLEFLILVHIMLGLVYNMMLPYIENVAFSFEGVSSLSMHLVNNYSYQIDGLMALSAFYTTFLLYGSVTTLRQSFDYILMRFMRFWPAYVVCVLFMYMIFPGISSGPMWIHSDTVGRCETGWWKNLLFINNWYNVTDTCMDFGYVISMEAQYFVILIFVIYLSVNHILATQIAAYLGIVVSIGITFYRSFSQELPPAPMLTAEPVPIEMTYKLFDQILLSPFTRISCYCQGFIFGIGCVTAGEELRKRGLSYLWHLVLAVLMLATGVYTVIGSYWYAAYDYDNGFLCSAYAALHRPFWCFALLSFVYLCHHGAFAWINALLEWRVFAPLSKVTWMTLVLAEPVILYIFSSLNKPAHATHWSTIYTAISATTLSYLGAIILDIFVTRPIRYLVYREQRHRYAQAHAQDNKP